MSLKHVHTRERADGLKETVVEIKCSELADKLKRVHELLGQICDGPIEAMLVLTQLLDIYKQHTETKTLMVTGAHRAQ